MPCYELFLFKLPVIKEILAALKVVYDATTAVQNASFTLSDFFGCWLQVLRRLNVLAANESAITDFAQILLSNIELKRGSLINNQAMICAIYLDRRFDFKLTEDEIAIAKLTLERLYDRVQKAKATTSAVPTNSKDDDSFEEECVASGLPRAFPNSHENTRGFTDWLDAYDATDRQHNKSSVLKFWHDNKYVHPQMYELATIIHSIPPTQATVERYFSTFGYIYNCRRTRLLPTILEKILIINLNVDLVDPIHERQIISLLNE